MNAQPKMLTDGEIAEIMERFAGSELAYDAMRLEAEINRLADKISDCWLFMDQLVRSGVSGPVQVELARKILQAQQAPGWKS